MGHERGLGWGWEDEEDVKQCCRVTAQRTLQ